ncbi:hypothetical protein GOP56_20860 [Brevibacillus sp. 7WMA2]|nr:hypothetical protein [Brevibacillus sp. 7WMA2]QIC04125.1 hypothetical protein GOP56_20860 [Brevibacillus sp. 7WMA2]
MKIPQAFFKAFPAYEDVFYDEIEQHRKHFLPICSINLQCVFPERSGFGKSGAEMKGCRRGTIGSLFVLQDIPLARMYYPKNPAEL